MELLELMDDIRISDEHGNARAVMMAAPTHLMSLSPKSLKNFPLPLSKNMRKVGRQMVRCFLSHLTKLRGHGKFHHCRDSSYEQASCAKEADHDTAWLSDDRAHTNRVIKAVKDL